MMVAHLIFHASLVHGEQEIRFGIAIATDAISAQHGPSVLPGKMEQHNSLTPMQAFWCMIAKLPLMLHDWELSTGPGIGANILQHARRLRILELGGFNEHVPPGCGVEYMSQIGRPCKECGGPIDRPQGRQCRKC